MSNLTLQILNEFYLKVLTGKLKNTVFKLNSNEIFIGRDPTNHISIPDDAALSRKHARLILIKGQYYIQNLSSKNFITVNNEQVSQTELKNNYIFTIGSQSFKFVSTPKNKKTSLNSSPNISKATQKSKPSTVKNIFYTVMILLITSGLYLFNSDPYRSEKKSLRKIATTEKILERMEENKKNIAKIIEKNEISGRNSLEYKSAHAFYIKGFRDFQKGLYAQALSSFETCLSIYPSHKLARRYTELSTNRQEELISFNMTQGNTNLKNGKHDFCISSFKNAMSEINDKTDNRYIEARQLLKKCKFLKRSKY